MARIGNRRGRVPFDRSRRSGPLRIVIFLILVAAFIITPFFLTRSIIYLEPQQGVMLLGVFAIAILFALPLGRRAVNTRILVFALAFYVGFDVMWADYVAVDIPFLPYITPVKLVILMLAGFWIVLAASSREIHDRMWKALTTLPILTFALATVIFFNLLATPFSIDRAASSRELFNDVVFFYIPFLIAATTIRSRGDVDAILKTLVYCAGAVGVIVVLESILHRNLYVAVFGKWINYDAPWLRLIFAGASRDGKYRALGPFVNYLSLGDYFVLTLPFVLYFFERAKSVWLKLLLGSIFALSIYGIFAADSRTSLLAALIVCSIYGVIKALNFLSFNQGSPLRPLIVLVLVGGMVAAPLAVWESYRRVGGDNAFGAAGSRTLMFQAGIPKIKHRPIIGYGPGTSGIALDFRSDGVNLTIDSYYLSMALDAGIPGLIGFLLLPTTLVVVAFRRMRRNTPDAPLFLAFCLSGIGFGLVRSTTSQYENINFFHILLGAFVALLLLIKEETAASPELAAAEAKLRPSRRRRRRRFGEASLFSRGPGP